MKTCEKANYLYWLWQDLLNAELRGGGGSGAAETDSARTDYLRHCSVCPQCVEAREAESADLLDPANNVELRQAARERR